MRTILIGLIVSSLPVLTMAQGRGRGPRAEHEPGDPAQQRAHEFTRCVPEPGTWETARLGRRRGQEIGVDQTEKPEGERPREIEVIRVSSSIPLSPAGLA